jgi:hypothetical protein
MPCVDMAVSRLCLPTYHRVVPAILCQPSCASRRPRLVQRPQLERVGLPQALCGRVCARNQAYSSGLAYVAVHASWPASG